MCQLPPQSIRTYTLFPSPTLFRSLAPILRQNLVIGEPLEFAQDGIGAERLGQFRRRAKAFRQRVAIIAGDKEERHGPVLEQFGDGVRMFAIEIGRASCREGVSQYVKISLVAVTLTKTIVQQH